MAPLRVISSFFAPSEREFVPAADVLVLPDLARPHPSLDRLHFLRALPGLGNVLCLMRTTKANSAALAALAIDLDDDGLWPLAAWVQAQAHHAVTPAGPREWIDLVDGDGRSLAKLFLLPDTDYLAWDDLVAPLAEAPSQCGASGWNAHLAFHRSALLRLGARWRARLLRFELAGDPRRPRLRRCREGRASLLDLEVAVAIAQAEGAHLSGPDPE